MIHLPCVLQGLLLLEELHEEEGGDEEQADDEQHQPRPALAPAHARHLRLEPLVVLVELRLVAVDHD